MPTTLPASEVSPPEPGFRITGRFVLLAMLGFFGTVVGVNLVMARLAVSTFGGVETASAYKAGRAFAAESAAADAQRTRNWRVEAALRRGPDGAVRLEVRPSDTLDHPLAGLVIVADLRHPTHAPDDRAVVLQETGPGLYTGSATVNPGQWHLRLDISQDGVRVFRSDSRVILK